MFTRMALQGVLVCRREGCGREGREDCRRGDCRREGCGREGRRNGREDCRREGCEKEDCGREGGL